MGCHVGDGVSMVELAPNQHYARMIWIGDTPAIMGVG